MPSILCVFRRYRHRVAFPVFAIVLSGLSACGKSEEWEKFSTLAATPKRLAGLQREFGPEPVRALQALPSEYVNNSMVALGNQLFHDKRLSGDETISCASCHDLQAGGGDGRVLSEGIRGQVGVVNTPTVLNSAHSFRQFWDGRSHSLTLQALEPIVNSIEMGADWPVVIDRLSTDEALLALFKDVFGTHEIEPLLIAEAIAAFERTLITPAPFDQYLRGDDSAISNQAMAGYELFKDYGCTACHQGVNLGGNVMQYFGAFHAVDDSQGDSMNEFEGRNMTPIYKVPTLRNIALTAPYFHTGSVVELSDAVKIMGVVQLGRIIDDEDVSLIVAFLESLTGEVPRHVLSANSAATIE